MTRGRKVALSAIALCASLATVLALAAATGDLARVRPASPVRVRRPLPRRSVREARIAAAEHAAISRVLSYTATVFSGGSRRRDVALTFDDGPSVFTPAVVATLRRMHAPATFFQVGSQIARYPTFARAELTAGLGIGDHTETHPFLAALSPAAQRAQIVAVARQIHDYGAPYPRLFRPPYESYDSATLRVTRGDRMLTVLWSVDTRDFTRPGVRQIAATAFAEVRPGAIILMHDGGGPRAQTVAALPAVIDGLRRRGYRLVTVGRLLLDDPPARPVRAARRASAAAAAAAAAVAGRRRGAARPGRTARSAPASHGRAAPRRSRRPVNTARGRRRVAGASA